MALRESAALKGIPEIQYFILFSRPGFFYKIHKHFIKYTSIVCLFVYLLAC